MNYKSATKFKISNNIVFRKQPDGNYILLEIDGDLIFNLDEVSAFIWHFIAEGANFGEILEKLADEYENFENSELNDVNSFITELVEMKIISIL